MKHANPPVVLRISRLRLWWLYVNHDPALGMSILVGLVAGIFCSFCSFGFFLPQWDLALLIRGERTSGTVLQKWIASAPERPNELALAHGGRGPKPRVVCLGFPVPTATNCESELNAIETAQSLCFIRGPTATAVAESHCVSRSQPGSAPHTNRPPRAAHLQFAYAGGRADTGRGSRYR